MKKYLVSTLLLSISLFSCSKIEELPFFDKPEETVLDITFDLSAIEGVIPNSEVHVPYVVESSAASVAIEVVAYSGLTAEVVAADATNKIGSILIRVGDSCDAASKVVVFVSADNDVVMKSIYLQTGASPELPQLYIYNGATKDVSASGGSVTLSFLTNVECQAVIPAEASDWISLDATRAVEYDSIALSVAMNMGDRRSAIVKVESLDGVLSVEYTIVQAGAASSSTPDVDDEGNILGTPQSNEIFYTSTDGNIVEPYDGNVFGGIIISNTYNNGVGVIVFDRPITAIGSSAFRYCSLTSITIPDSVTTIGYEAFYKCYSLTSVTIPNSVTTIGGWAFYQCDSLTSVTIPDSVTTIEGAAFNCCFNLTSVTIPDSVTTIGGSAFYKCYSLTSVTIPDSVTEIGGSAFYDCISLTSVTIPDSVTTIGGSVFYNCSSLTNVTIGAGLNNLNGSLFAGCTSLTSVVIPDNITTIWGSAFEGCSALERVEIGTGIKSISDYAFRYCYILNDISVKAVTPPTIYASSFGDIGTKPTFRVPNASVEAYKTAEYWSDYADMIIGCAF